MTSMFREKRIDVTRKSLVISPKQNSKKPVWSAESGKIYECRYLLPENLDLII